MTRSEVEAIIDSCSFVTDYRCGMTGYGGVPVTVSLYRDSANNSWICMDGSDLVYLSLPAYEGIENRVERALERRYQYVNQAEYRRTTDGAWATVA